MSDAVSGVYAQPICHVGNLILQNLEFLAICKVGHLPTNYHMYSNSDPTALILGREINTRAIVWSEENHCLGLLYSIAF